MGEAVKQLFPPTSDGGSLNDRQAENTCLFFSYQPFVRERDTSRREPVGDRATQPLFGLAAIYPVALVGSACRSTSAKIQNSEPVNPRLKARGKTEGWRRAFESVSRRTLCAPVRAESDNLHQYLHSATAYFVPYHE